MLDLLLFILGFGTGVLTHEAGHYAVGELSGGRVSWEWSHVSCDNPCPNTKTFAAGGFIAQAVSSELLLLPEKRGPFMAGWLSYNILGPVAYTIRHEAFGPSGDLRHFGRGEARIIEAVAIGHTATVALRWAWKDKPDWFEVSPFENGVKAALVARW